MLSATLTAPVSVPFLTLTSDSGSDNLTFPGMGECSPLIGHLSPAPVLSLARPPVLADMTQCPELTFISSFPVLRPLHCCHLHCQDTRNCQLSDSSLVSSASCCPLIGCKLITQKPGHKCGRRRGVNVATFKLQTGMVSQFYRRSQILQVYFEGDLHLDLSNEV